MAENPAMKKGIVTPISSLLPAEEAHKASKRVQDTIAERQEQRDQLKGFMNANTNLINLVQRLPDELHHNIMVPFGKVAFFPGRLIHTNELVILLGVDHYVERTSKQTIDILNRRGRGLENQLESLKAVIQDLKAEASFFDTTASEAVGRRPPLSHSPSYQKRPSVAFSPFNLSARKMSTSVPMSTIHLKTESMEAHAT